MRIFDKGKRDPGKVWKETYNMVMGGY